MRHHVAFVENKIPILIAITSIMPPLLATNLNQKRSLLDCFYLSGIENEEPCVMTFISSTIFQISTRFDMLLTQNFGVFFFLMVGKGKETPTQFQI
jgi:hypothetical protein